ncbi:hypothetical protein BCT47_23600 [Vibrio splendidus]|uniref:hypothetical protein n=1 Tax=Vibrio TaxID=662 RepID=UPI0006CA25E1|nr:MULTISPECIES: hypothetical protein [Vibrio]KPL97545.1 hypothetical protein AN167_22360 [Vibrio splendidus]MCC5517375.1 hypothetical protein [Vibrio splendidus]PMJ42987.1 hypothetical protein BCU24_07460 [Vibrio cyclitrophicus]PMM73844.1 hypothetical protein BCT47_23600 [Vibrio splendidus]PMO69606.1 hypothetical protein BCT03_04680 [Vibrio splendidus]
MDYILAGVVIFSVSIGVASIKRCMERYTEKIITSQKQLESNLIEDNLKLKEQVNQQTEELLIMMRYVKIHKSMDHFKDFRDHMKTAMSLNHDGFNDN